MAKHKCGEGSGKSIDYTKLDEGDQLPTEKERMTYEATMLNKVKAVNSSSLGSVISMQMKEGVVYQKLRNPMEEVERKGHRGGAGDNMH